MQYTRHNSYQQNSGHTAVASLPDTGAAPPRAAGQNTPKLKRLIGPFAREIRNPVASLLTASEVLLEELGPAHRCAGYARLINDTSSRLHDSISDLLVLARPLNFQLTEIAISPFVTAEIERVIPAAEGNGIRLVSAFPSERILVTANRDALSLALNKLFTHQIDVMKLGGVLEVAVETLTHRRVRILCSDTGPNVPHAQLHRLFDPFFSLDGRHPGMALALLKRIITQSGGRVSARQKDGGGLTIEMKLIAAP